MIDLTPDGFAPDEELKNPGIMTLCLFEAWVEEGARVVAPRSWRLRVVEELIAKMSPYDPAQRSLTRIIGAMQGARSAQASIVAPHLLAYGTMLDICGRWSLATHVYRMIVAHIDPLEQADIAIQALIKLGYCHRLLARWNEAATAYTTAGQVAAMAGNMRYLITAQIGNVKIIGDQGNLSVARLALDEFAQQAIDAEIPGLRAQALHECGAAAHRMGDCDTAITYFYRALHGLETLRDREHLFLDLSGALVESGQRNIGRDVLLMLVATTQESYVKWRATINLMDITISDGQESAFEQYRRELMHTQLPARIAAYYHLNTGEGYHRFKQYSKAREAYKRVLDISAKHKVEDLRQKAEQFASELPGGWSI